MRIALGADHAGYELKGLVRTWLEGAGHQVTDVGAHQLDPEDDYPDFAAAVARSVQSGQAERGIIVCGSGVGASITANKVAGVRACLCHDSYTSHQGVEHDDMNVLCLGARVIGIETAREAVRAFLAARFMPEPRFQRRLEKLLQVEREGGMASRPDAGGTPPRGFSYTSRPPQ
jgi:ribose 5-phosphate isomerase B